MPTKNNPSKPADSSDKPAGGGRSASAGSAFDALVGELDYRKVWGVLEPMLNAGPICCDDAQSILSVMMGPDSDMHLMMKRHPRADRIKWGESFRCRTWEGGGRYSRVHTALTLLAIALIADEPESRSMNEQNVSSETRPSAPNPNPNP